MQKQKARIPTDLFRSHRRLFRKARIFTRPTPAAISPARPESAKTASSPMDAPFRGQGRSKRPKIVLPSSLIYGILRMTRMSPPLRASIPISYSFPHVNTQPSKGARSFRLRPSNEALQILQLVPSGQATCPPLLAFPHSISLSGVAWPILDCARPTIQIFPPSLLVISQGWGLIDLPLRASNEGFRKPRVARAQGTHRAIPPPAGGLCRQPARYLGLGVKAGYFFSSREPREEDEPGRWLLQALEGAWHLVCAS